MTTPSQQYAELVALTRRYLLQEYAADERLYTDFATYSYFRENAQKKLASAAKPSAPKSVPHDMGAIQQPLRQELLKSAIQPTPLQPMQMKPGAERKIQGSQPAQVAAPKEIEKGSVTPSVDAPVKSTKEFTLEAPPAYEACDHQEIRKILQERFPSLRIINTIPNDQDATKLAKLWEHDQELPQVLLLIGDESEKQKLFLENLRIAIESYGLSAKVVSISKIDHGRGWEPILQDKGLKLIISNSSHLAAFPHLKTHVRRTTKLTLQTLGEVPLFLLADFSSYFKESSLKPLLWKNLKEVLDLF